MVNGFSLHELSNAPNEIELQIQKFSNSLKSYNGKVVLFGAGIIGSFYLEYFRRYNIYSDFVFCDNSPKKWGTIIKGIPVICFDELKAKYKESKIIISSLNYRDEMISQLQKAGLHNNLITSAEDITITSDVAQYEAFKDYYHTVNGNLGKFESLYSILSDEFSKRILYERINFCITADTKYLIPLKSKSPQYFEPGIVGLSKDEIFIDGGAYIGDTVDEFIKQTSGEFDKIYSFEPEITKHKEFINKFSSIRNIELVPYGLWSQKEVLFFSAENTGSSRVSEKGDIEIPVISIDEVLNGKPVTFIKMDIEGAELEALKGAADSIRKYKPKLAICIYHKPLDLVDIPLYLKALVPEYKFYLRHYDNGASETVCYAVI